MRKMAFAAIIILAITGAAFHAACKRSTQQAEQNAASAKSIQYPAVAGSFYPADPAELKKEVQDALAAAPSKEIEGRIIGLVVPHAGYRYSAQVAAAGFRQIAGKSYSKVVVMAPSHRVPFIGAAVLTRDTYKMPLGDIPVDVKSERELMKRDKLFISNADPYDVEHALEVELPFLQLTLKDFTLVPLIIGEAGKSDLDAIAAALDAQFPSDDVLFVASSDLSHYHPYDDATVRDKKTVSLICDAGADAYMNAVMSGGAELCGSSPVYILKKIAEKRGAKLTLVEYANSGDTAGDKSKVVGYSAIVATIKDKGLGDRQKKELISLARKTLEAHVRGEKLPPLPSDPELKSDGAAFVTLKKRGELRGCIGQIIAHAPLDQTVQEMTISAASSDPRFPHVEAGELKEISIEISVLTPPKELSDPLSVRVGTDGLIIEKGMNRGVLLPQVPTEQGWNKQQYLEGICHKAGLPSDAWKDAKLYRFQAIVFKE